MAVRNPPSWISARTDHVAYGMRRLTSALTRYSPGVCDSTHLAVTERSGTTSMSVDVAAGAAFVNGTEATYQGMYHLEAETVTNVVIAASNATNPRRDLIVARVRDAQYSGSTNAWALEAVTGTAAASPVDPAVPANSLVLARVSVAANASTITNASITDLRASYGPSPLTWAIVVDQGGALSRNVSAANYLRDGRLVVANFAVDIVSTGAAGSTEVSVSLPIPTSTVNVPLGSGEIVDWNTSAVYVGTWIAVTTTTAKMWVHGSLFPVNFQLGAQDLVRGVFTYFTAS